MSTQALLDKIAAERDEQIAVIEAEAKVMIKTIEADAAIEVAAIEKAATTKSQKEIVALKRATLSKARQQGKLVVQTAKREAFDAVLAMAEKVVVIDDTDSARAFADQKPELEVLLAKQIG